MVEIKFTVVISLLEWPYPLSTQRHTGKTLSMQTQPSCINRMQPSKSLGEKDCEIKGSGHEMAAMMLMINNGFTHYYCCYY